MDSSQKLSLKTNDAALRVFFSTLLFYTNVTWYLSFNSLSHPATHPPSSKPITYLGKSCWKCPHPCLLHCLRSQRKRHIWQWSLSAEKATKVPDGSADSVRTEEPWDTFSERFPSQLTHVEPRRFKQEADRNWQRRFYQLLHLSDSSSLTWACPELQMTRKHNTDACSKTFNPLSNSSIMWECKVSRVVHRYSLRGNWTKCQITRLRHHHI